jgi:4-oxalocrotonate tautomerase
MPTVQIEMFEGRTIEQKKALVAKVTQAIVESVGAPPENVTIIIREMARENHAKAGILTSERK